MDKNCKTCKHGISMDKVCKNCKHGFWGAELPKVCLSCKEGEFWEPKEAMELNWIEWNGGECPVPDGHDVSVKYRRGDTEQTEIPELFCWRHYDTEGDIVAYYDHTAVEQEEEAMDIWKAAPAQAEYYGKDTDSFYKLINGVVMRYEGDTTWEPAGYTKSVLERRIEAGGLIKRPQAEQEEPKEWKNGIPPTGEKCLLNVSKSIAYEVVLEWVSDKNVVFRHCDDDAEQFAAKDWFKANVRPSKSQAEKEREEAIKTLESILLDDTTLYKTSCYGIAEVIINAGYRLDTKGDV